MPKNALGYENPDGALYCMRCGYPLTSQTSIYEQAFNILKSNQNLLYN